MRTIAVSLVISIVFSISAWSQTTPQPSRGAAPAKPAKPIAAAAAKRGMAAVSKSPLPTFDEGTYQRISAAMLSYAAIEVRGGWPTVPADLKLAPGAFGPEVALLRRRLVASDDLPAGKAEG